MRYTFKSAIVVLGLGLGSAISCSTESVAAEATLKLQTPGGEETFTLKSLRARLKTATLTVKDPVYKETKTYEGFWLRDVMALIDPKKAAGDEIVFQCADGYAPTMPFASAGTAPGLLAFREKGAKGGWTRLKQGKAWITPAPFYVVWESKVEGLPWAYQVVGIEVVDFKQKYSRIFPADQGAETPVARGFATFRAECLKCHSINLQGGVLGPELNYPKNITEYWKESDIVAFVRDPNTFRARSKMPAFPQLKDGQISDILAYLKWAKEHKQGE